MAVPARARLRSRLAPGPSSCRLSLGTPPEAPSRQCHQQSCAQKSGESAFPKRKHLDVFSVEQSAIHFSERSLTPLKTNISPKATVCSLRETPLQRPFVSPITDPQWKQPRVILLYCEPRALPSWRCLFPQKKRYTRPDVTVRLAARRLP